MCSLAYILDPRVVRTRSQLRLLCALDEVEAVPAGESPA